MVNVCVPIKYALIVLSTRISSNTHTHKHTGTSFSKDDDNVIAVS